MIDSSQTSSSKVSQTIHGASAVTNVESDFVSSGKGRRGVTNGVSKDVRHIGRQRKYPHPDLSKKDSTPPEFDHRKWLNSKQAAEYLGTTDKNIRNLVLERRLPAYKPFGKLLFEKADLDRKILATRVW